MKATGMIRRIDELGRVVIPKEIRKTLRIKVGDELEIFTEDDGILVMKKHSRIVGFDRVGRGVVEAIYRSLGGTVLLADMSHVLFAGGAYRRQYEGIELSDNMLEVIDRRRGSVLSGANIVSIVRGETTTPDSIYVSPVISGGDLYGALMMVMHEGDIHESVSVVDTAASFLALGLDL